MGQPNTLFENCLRLFIHYLKMDRLIQYEYESKTTADKNHFLKANMLYVITTDSVYIVLHSLSKPLHFESHTDGGKLLL